MTAAEAIDQDAALKAPEASNMDRVSVLMEELGLLDARRVSIIKELRMRGLNYRDPGDPPGIKDGTACVYVMRSNDWLKVGYTSRFPERWRIYRTNSPDASFVAAWPGTRDDEISAFGEVRAFGFRPARGNEWFHCCDELLAWAIQKQAALGEWWNVQSWERPDLIMMDPKLERRLIKKAKRSSHVT